MNEEYDTEDAFTVYICGKNHVHFKLESEDTSLALPLDQWYGIFETISQFDLQLKQLKLEGKI